MPTDDNRLGVQPDLGSRHLDEARLPASESERRCVDRVRGRGWALEQPSTCAHPNPRVDRRSIRLLPGHDLSPPDGEVVELCSGVSPQNVVRVAGERMRKQDVECSYELGEREGLRQIIVTARVEAGEAVNERVARR